jgi:hypothetical protein
MAIMIPRKSTNRRDFLRILGAAGLALPFAQGLLRGEAAAGNVAKRIIFFYFPDGVLTGELNGGSGWHPTGSEHDFTLSDQLAPLAPHKDACVFFRGLGMGSTDEGSHPGGAKKLLTATDGGMGQSIDQHLAATVGASSPYHHLYLGAAATKSGTGDKCISYPDGSGNSVSPIDNPRVAFESLFGAGSMSTSGGGTSGTTVDPAKATVIDGVLGDMKRLRGELGSVEKEKLDLHADALNEMEKRIKGMTVTPGGSTPPASCGMPSIGAVDDAKILDDASFPDVLKAQIDLMVLAMACGKTRVGTIQGSYHTSQVNMNRFVGTEMYNPSYDISSHTASHYTDDPGKLLPAFAAQVRWWMGRYAYLLSELASRPDPEGGGSMLDGSLVVLCSEVSDGKVHSHHDMPFVLAGGGGGTVKTGRLLQYSNESHGKLFVSLAQAMGQSIQSFGSGNGPLAGLLG